MGGATKDMTLKRKTALITPRPQRMKYSGLKKARIPERLPASSFLWKREVSHSASPMARRKLHTEASPTSRVAE